MGRALIFLKFVKVMVLIFMILVHKKHYPFPNSDRKGRFNFCDFGQKEASVEKLV